MTKIAAALAVVLCVIASPTWAASVCTGVFKEVEELSREEIGQVLDQTFWDYMLRLKHKMMTAPADWANIRRQAHDEIHRLLTAQGYVLEPLPPEKGFFRIVPGQGSHPLSKLVTALDRKGIAVNVNPDIWYEANGAYYAKQIEIDRYTLAYGRPSATILHEIRHAIDEKRSQMDGREFERIFQTELSARKTPSKTLPGLNSEDSYSDRYSLDEILAHRQSLATHVANLHFLLKNGYEGKGSAQHIRDHAERLQNFIRGWRASAEALRTHIADDNFAFHTFFREGENYGELFIEARRPGFLRRLFGAAHDPTIEGLELIVMISRQELSTLRFRQDVARLMAQKLPDLSRHVLSLEPAIEAHAQAVRDFDGKDITELQRTANELTRAIATTRKSLNIGANPDR